jgi:MFS family permease
MGVIRVALAANAPQGAATERSKWALALLFTVDGVGFGTWAAHVPVFKQSLHLENGSLTFVLVSLILGAILTMPLTGFLCERYGSRRVVQISAVVYVSMVALLAQAFNLPSLMLFAGLYGASKGAFDVAVNAHAVPVEKAYGSPIMSFFQGCWSAGGLFGAGAASLLLQHGGTTRKDLSLTAGALILCCLWALPAQARVAMSPTARPGKQGKFPLPDAGLLRLALIAFFGLMAEGAISDWASVYLHSNVGVTLSLAAAGYAAYAIAMAAGRFTGDWLAQRLSGRTILHGSGMLVAIGMACALLAPSWYPAVGGLMLTGLGIANIVPVIWGAAGRNTRLGAGPAISMVTTVGYFGFLAGPPIIGSISVVVGLRLAMVAIAIAGLVVAAGPFFFSIEATSPVASEEQIAI